MRTPVTVLASAMLLALPSVAFGQDECPPGGWFCEEAPDEPPEDDAGVVLEEYEASPEPPSRVEVPRDREGSPPVVVYYPSDRPPPIVVERESKPKPPKRRRLKKEWGFNLRLEGVLMGDNRDRHSDAGMGGIGFSFRYRPIPYFAFDVGADFLGGTDYEGNARRENALLFSGIIFFNPKDKLQVYTIGGFGFSGAGVEVKETREVVFSDGSIGTERVVFDDSYRYFGGHLGLGLEWRVSKKVALDFDVVGFVRGRTDADARVNPEFVDPDTGRTTNTSGGGLVRGGVTFYW